MMRIGIIGCGFVGSAVRKASEKHFETVCHDTKWKCSKLEDVLDTSLVFVCVPTPTNADGSQNLTIVRAVCAELKELGYEGEVVIKSTVRPRTCEILAQDYELKIVHNPEFLTERNAAIDFVEQPAVLLGGPIASAVIDFYRKVFPRTPIRWFVKSRVTEHAKYYHNTFLALKVIYNNEIKRLCEADAVDFDDVRYAAISQQRILANHTAVPGPDGRGGFGGTCFPKDVAAYVDHAHGLKTPLMLLELAHAINLNLRPEEYRNGNGGQAAGHAAPVPSPA